MHGITPTPCRHGPVPELTVAVWIDRHVGALSGVERKTLAEYRRYVTRDSQPTLGDIPPPTLRAPTSAPGSTPCAPPTPQVRHFGNTVGFPSGCLNDAVREGH